MLGCCAVSACAIPTAYEVSGPAGQHSARIYQPNTRIVTRPSRSWVQVDILDIVSPGERCRTLPREGGLSARSVQVLREGRLSRALRFEGRREHFESADALTQAFNAWWGENGPGTCVGASERGALLQSLLAQRPLSPSQAVEQWYGPERDGPRMVLLRPGMRVCAADVGLNRDYNGFAAGAPQCARLSETITGPRFEPIAGRFARPLVQDQWTPGIGDYQRVWSWAEVQQPFTTADGSYKPVAHAILYPGTLPQSASLNARNRTACPQDSAVAGDDRARIACLGTETLSDPVNANGVSWLVIIDLSKDHALDRVREAARNITYGELCRSEVNDVVCVRFGDRATYTVDIPIWLNGQAFDAPLGSTLGSIIAMQAPDFLSGELLGPTAVRASSQPAANARLTRAMRHLRVQRWFEGRRVRVHVDDAALDLPLQPGDEITW